MMKRLILLSYLIVALGLTRGMAWAEIELFSGGKLQVEEKDPADQPEGETGISKDYYANGNLRFEKMYNNGRMGRAQPVVFSQRLIVD